MKKLLPGLFILLAACNQPDSTSNTAPKDSTIFVPADSISEIRSTVKSNPVASYSEPIKDELNDWKFAVALYETKRRFHYTVRIQCKEIRVTDSVNIPNFGIDPKIEIRKGNESLTCVIGFLNKKNEFLKYRQVSFRNDRLQIKTVANYSVSAYKTKTNSPD